MSSELVNPTGGTFTPGSGSFKQEGRLEDTVHCDTRAPVGSILVMVSETLDPATPEACHSRMAVSHKQNNDNHKYM